MPHLLALTAARGTIALGAGRAFRLARAARSPRPTARPRWPSSRAATCAATGRRAPPTSRRGPACGLRDARAGLAAIARSLAPRGELVDLAGRPDAPVAPPRLLPAFDPYLLGWRDRGFAVGAGDARRVHPGGGILRATAIARGRAVATWSLRGGRVALDPFAPLPAGVAAALRREAEAVERFARAPAAPGGA